MNEKKLEQAKVGERVFVDKCIYARKRDDGAITYGIAFTDSEGRRIRENVGPTITLARKVLAKRQAEVAEGRYFPKKKQAPTFAEFAERYLEHAREHKRSWKRDDGVMKKLVAVFGSRPLDKISPLDVERYKAESVKTVQRASVNRETAILRRAYNLAIKWGVLPAGHANPAAGEGVMFRERERTFYPLSIEQQAALVVACPEHLRPIVIAALGTGLRKGELLALAWSDVDLVRGVLTVRQSKSGRVRHVPLNSAVLGALRGIDAPREGKVFRFRGDAITANVNRSFARARRAAGLEDVRADEHGRRYTWPRFHDLRHTFATNLVLGGADLATVKELMGHANIAMTMRYSHATGESKRRAVDSLPDPFLAHRAEEGANTVDGTTPQVVNSPQFASRWPRSSDG